jgi:hypothetical protein
MMGMLMETVVIAFVMGGIMGAITALHLLGPKKIAVKADDNRAPQKQRR